MKILSVSLDSAVLILEVVILITSSSNNSEADVILILFVTINLYAETGDCFIKRTPLGAALSQPWIRLSINCTGGVMGANYSGRLIRL